MFNKQSKIVLFIVCLVLILSSCSNNTSKMNNKDIDENTKEVSSIKNYTTDELVEKIQAIDFGIKKEAIIKTDGAPDYDSDNDSNEDDNYLSYFININSKKCQLFYFINNNDNLHSIAIFLPEEETYNGYVDEYKLLVQSLTKTFGNSTGNNDVVKNDDSNNYGYSVYIGESQYRSEWDLDNIRIVSSLRGSDDGDRHISALLCLESKVYPE